MEIKFTKVEVKEWKALRTLEEGAASDMFAPCNGEEGYKKYIHESNVFIITNENKPVGTISYKNQDNGFILINGLTVLPENRERGIAKQAMSKLLKEVGNKNFELVVHPRNTPAILIYLSLGFSIIEWRENYFGDGEPRLYLQRKAVI